MGPTKILLKRCVRYGILPLSLVTGFPSYFGFPTNPWVLHAQEALSVAENTGPQWVDRPELSQENSGEADDTVVFSGAEDSQCYSYELTYDPEEVSPNFLSELMKFENRVYEYLTGEDCEFIKGNPWVYPMRVYLDHVEGRWLDNTQGYTSLGLFSGITEYERGSLLPIFDIRAHCFNNGKLASNLGLGLRYFNSDSSAVFGINVFYDFRKGPIASYNQLGAGFEVLSPFWDFRLNYYFPVDRRADHSCKGSFDDHDHEKWIASSHKKQVSMQGGDIELGRWFQKMGPCKNFDLYFALGGHFYNSKNRDKRYGGEARLLSHLGRYFLFEVKGGYDNLTKGMVQGSITFSLPIFESCQQIASDVNCGINSIALQPIHRQEMIVLNKEKRCWIPKDKVNK